MSDEFIQELIKLLEKFKPLGSNRSCTKHCSDCMLNQDIIYEECYRNTDICDALIKIKDKLHKQTT
jgi:hypothetical protein